MVPNNSLEDSYTIIAALIHDAYSARGLVFNSTRSLRLTQSKVKRRLMAEGMGFLTKTLPRLGKAFDKVLTGSTKLNAVELGFDPADGCEYPKLFGELFSCVLQPDGGLLPSPCTECVSVLRQLLFVFYKYELPYTDEQEHEVLSKFKQTEKDLTELEPFFENLEASVRASYSYRVGDSRVASTTAIARVAKDLLAEVFLKFDPYDIFPRHGPGVVATKQRLQAKYQWSNVARRITDTYPFDAYFQASLGAVCDTWNTYEGITETESPAQVLLVPKDSRGPRLISAEPVDFQWVQQGLGRAIVGHVERHWTTRFNIHFTEQQPNRFGALLGSRTGKYATLDLKEASDRVSVALVRLLFPEHVYTCLESCRSLSTVMPDGEEIILKKFAPMGSCLCFPIMALTIWALLTAGTTDADTRESILVYGDDVIVPTAYAASAIELLESFGLKINRDKSCTTGFFRESCGTDAFQGVDVTPVRFRTVWSESPSPDSYVSWIAYANSLFRKRYYSTYDLIVSRLVRLYGPIPGKDMLLTCPSLEWVPIESRPKRKRYRKGSQTLQYNVWDVRSPSINKHMDGWSKLLRYFSETQAAALTHENRKKLEEGAYPVPRVDVPIREFLDEEFPPRRQFSVGSYTSRHSSVLERRWR